MAPTQISVISVIPGEYWPRRRRAGLAALLWAWMAACVLLCATAGGFGANWRSAADAAVVALMPPLVGLILLARFRRALARGYFVFAWALAATFLAAMDGAARSPLAALFLLAPLMAAAIGGGWLIVGGTIGSALGFVAAAWLGRSAAPLALGPAPELLATAGLFFAGLTLLWSRAVEAETARRRLDRALAEAAHELRTPLGQIAGFADAIESQVFGPAPPRYVEYAGIIRTTSAGLVEQITRRLELLRAGLRRDALVLEEIDVAAIVSDVVRLAQSEAAAKQIALALDAAGPVPARADPVALRRIATNLVGNAVKYTPAHGRVRVSVRGDDDAVEIAVSDSGPGIPKAARARMLRPFVRGRSAEGGAGLGLALTQQLARLHAGALALRDGEDGGLKAVVRLPRAGPRQLARLG